MTQSDEEIADNYEETRLRDDNGNNIIGVWKYFGYELRGEPMSLKEPSGQYIDVANSFAPISPHYHHVMILRALLPVWSIVSLGLSIHTQEKANRFIYLGYATRQGLIFSIAYQISAFILTLHRTCLTQPNPDSQDMLSKPLKVVWFLYALSVPCEILITLLYWGFDYDKDYKTWYSMFYCHGVIAIMLLLDGNLIARIPLRIKQILFVEIYGLLYIIWTYIHSVNGIGNGNKDGDLIYDVIDWKGNPFKSLIISLIVLLVVAPLCFMFAWVLSLVGKGVVLNGGRRRLR